MKFWSSEVPQAEGKYHLKLAKISIRSMQPRLDWLRETADQLILILQCFIAIIYTLQKTKDRKNPIIEKYDGPTNRPTDRPTNGRSNRGVESRLKTTIYILNEVFEDTCTMQLILLNNPHHCLLPQSAPTWKNGIILPVWFSKNSVKCLKIECKKTARAYGPNQPTT